MARPRSPSPKHRATPDPLAAKIGARIRALRSAREVSFDAFVEELGAGRGYVSELERGLVVPTIAVLSKAADVLGVSIGDLVLVGDSPREQVFLSTRDLAPGVVRRLARDLKTLARDGS